MDTLEQPALLRETSNNNGFMHKLSIISQAFVRYHPPEDAPLLDLGSAYGVATIAALEQGRDVIACDIEQKHLDVLIDDTPPAYLDHLQTLTGKFPDRVDFDGSSIGGILVAHLFSFLSGEEIEKGLEKFQDWLVPGGKIFLINDTPYNSVCQPYLEQYEDDKAQGEKWPGFIENLRESNENKKLMHNLPDNLHFLEPDTLIPAFEEAGFSIEKAELFGGQDYCVPPQFQVDGKEWVGLIAKKK